MLFAAIACFTISINLGLIKDGPRANETAALIFLGLSILFVGFYAFRVVKASKSKNAGSAVPWLIVAAVCAIPPFFIGAGTNGAFLLTVLFVVVAVGSFLYGIAEFKK